MLDVAQQNKSNNPISQERINTHRLMLAKRTNSNNESQPDSQEQINTHTHTQRPRQQTTFHRIVEL